VVIALALGLGGTPGLHPHWRRTFWWAGAAALAGAVHHGLVTHSEHWSGPSWALISTMVVVTVSYLLAATVHEVLGPGRGRVFLALRAASLIAYAALALSGRAGIGTILLCEGVTMLAVLGLWGHAALRRHPLAGPVIAALGASAAAAGIKGLPPDVTGLVGLDPTSLYHVAQIPGMALLFVALTGAGARASAGPRAPAVA
jgi:hypothetical protein